MLSGSERGAILVEIRGSDTVMESGSDLRAGMDNARPSAYSGSASAFGRLSDLNVYHVSRRSSALPGIR